MLGGILMGLFWDMFKPGISVNEVELCLQELFKLWDVFCSFIDCDLTLREIYLKRLDCKWEFGIFYFRDDYECVFIVEYGSKKSQYVVKEGEDLSKEEVQKFKGYLFNSIKSISLLNNKVSDIIARRKLFECSTSVISMSTGRSIILHDGTDHIGTVGLINRRSVDDYTGSFYKSLFKV